VIIKDDINKYAANNIQNDIHKIRLKLKIDYGDFDYIELDDLEILKEYHNIFNNEFITEVLTDSDDNVVEWFYEYFKEDKQQLYNLMDIVIKVCNTEQITYLWNKIKLNL